jgi:hypothetical protein
VREPNCKALQAGRLEGLAYSAHETCKRSQYGKFLPFSEVENNQGQDEKQDAYTHPDTNKHSLGHTWNTDHDVSYGKPKFIFSVSFMYCTLQSIFT